MNIPSHSLEPRTLALVAGLLTLAFGCDLDSIQHRPTGEADVDRVTAADQALVDTLQRSNARIDMAAREAINSSDRYTTRGTTTREQPVDLRETAEALDDAGEQIAEDIDREKDEFVAASRERLRRLRLDLERVHARTDRRVDELDADLEQDRRRAEEQLERLIDASQEGYLQARDRVTQEIRDLEARMHALRERLEHAA